MSILDLPSIPWTRYQKPCAFISEDDRRKRERLENRLSQAYGPLAIESWVGVIATKTEPIMKHATDLDADIVSRELQKADRRLAEALDRGLDKRAGLCGIIAAAQVRIDESGAAPGEQEALNELAAHVGKMDETLRAVLPVDAIIAAALGPELSNETVFRANESDGFVEYDVPRQPDNPPQEQGEQ